MAKKKPVLHVSATGKEYVKMYGKTFKCCRKGVSHPEDWMWIGSVNRYIATKPYEVQ